MTKDIPSINESYVYNVELIRVIDGDTARLRLWKDIVSDIDFGFYIKEKALFSKSTEMNFRLYGVNAPEVRGVAESERLLGEASTRELEKILSSGSIVGRTYKPDKYGRWLIELWVWNPSGGVVYVNDHMVNSGNAVPYMQDK